MKHLLLSLTVALLLWQCRDTDQGPAFDPYDASQIEGDWVDLTGIFSPDWHYHFEDGLLQQDYIQAGATLSSLTYPYAVRDSVVYIGGDATNAPREWVLEFICADVVQVRNTGAMLGATFWLTRE